MRMDKFVVLYNGLAHWFKMKGQYLYRISSGEVFFTENEAIALNVLKYQPIKGSIVTQKKLLEMRRFYAIHPVSKSGKARTGVELLPENTIKRRTVWGNLD